MSGEPLTTTKQYVWGGHGDGGDGGLKGGDYSGWMFNEWYPVFCGFPCSTPLTCPKQQAQPWQALFLRHDNGQRQTLHPSNLRQDRWQCPERSQYCHCLIDVPVGLWSIGRPQTFIRKKKSKPNILMVQRGLLKLHVNKSSCLRGKSTTLPLVAQPRSTNLKILQFYLHIKAARYRISQ